MRSLREIRRFIRQAPVESRPKADQAVLRQLLTEFATATGGVSPAAKRCDRKAVARRWVVKALTAAATVILALVLVGPPRHDMTAPPLAANTPSAADLLTVGYLNAACRRGGLEAMDRQCEEAARRLGTRPERVSARELIREFDGAPASKG